MCAHGPSLGRPAPGTANNASHWGNLLRRACHDLQARFGFQEDSVANQIALVTSLINSRLPRMGGASQAVASIHLDVVSGPNANYAIWISAPSVASCFWNHDHDDDDQGGGGHVQIADSPQAWLLALSPGALSMQQQLVHIGLWFLIWGEAAHLRFCPEFLAFIFHCALLEIWAALASDQDFSATSTTGPRRPASFLNDIVRPVYLLIRSECYLPSGAVRERDHERIVGYDDWNECFWDGRWLGDLYVSDSMTGERNIYVLRQPQRRWYHLLSLINWPTFARKTFFESRTFAHLFVNFSRIWVLHVAFFATLLPHVVFNAFVSNARGTLIFPDAFLGAISIVMLGLGGLASTILQLVVLIVEPCFIPASWTVFQSTIRRLGLVLLFLIANVSLVGTCLFGTWPRRGRTVFNQNLPILPNILAVTQVLISLITCVLMIMWPFPWRGNDKKRACYWSNCNSHFTAQYERALLRENSFSKWFWTGILVVKVVSSHFFLILPLGDLIRIIVQRSCADALLFDPLFCRYYGGLVSGIVVLLAFILYNLDTFVWYTIATSFLGFCLAFVDGASIFRPWQGVFIRLPERIRAKILPSVTAINPMLAVAAIWNRIVLALHSEFYISRAQRDNMLYRYTNPSASAVISFQDAAADNQALRPEHLDSLLAAPEYFMIQEDMSSLHASSEANRRIRFFGQTLSMRALPRPMEMHLTPSLTVLVPHFTERVLLSTRELLRDSDIMQLAYLRKLFLKEWSNFQEYYTNSFVHEHGSTEFGLPLAIEALVGFRTATVEVVRRTRRWASTRTQTLYRTVRGMMQYYEALSLLAALEHPGMAEDAVRALLHGNVPDLGPIAQLISQKFCLLVAMQCFTSFTLEEQEDVYDLTQEFPGGCLRISYLRQVTPQDEDDHQAYYVCLMGADDERDVSQSPSSRVSRGSHWRDWKEVYRIELPGPPILGDGKSDNQQMSIIFHRGEVIQLIDANQDHFFEEALKLRCMLTEFTKPESSTLAIVGAREFIFSEAIGLLGNVAAGKEFTFGTLTQRVMAFLHSRLHYGHPDYLNFVFMATRGGISKGQRGLHLNEDIYAGMNAMMRGGQVKHTEYIQCGKGRDLGFESILKFTAKIGAGMAEQIISREHYYLGTQLPLDRLLTFYYAHAGFHLNNVFCLQAIRLFVLLIALLTWYFPEPDSEFCKRPNTSTCPGINTRDRDLLLDWIRQSLLAFIVYFMSYLPFFLQLMCEYGVVAALRRLGHQVISLAPVFETMMTQMYSHSLCAAMASRQARYFPTGRSVKTARSPFAALYAHYANVSIYIGVFLSCMLIFAWISLPSLPALAFVAFITFSLWIAPFLFNPHQFAQQEVLADYAQTLPWIFSMSGWAKDAHVVKRISITGLHDQFQVSSKVRLKKVVSNLLLAIIMAWMLAGLLQRSFMEFPKRSPWASVLTIAAAAILPLVVSTVLHLSVMPIIFLVCRPFRASSLSNALAIIVHFLCYLVVTVVFVFCAAVVEFRPRFSILAIMLVCQVKQFLLVCIYALLTSEPKGNGAKVDSNGAWWTAEYSRCGFTSFPTAFTQVLFRETLCKFAEGYDRSVDAWLIQLIHCFFIVPLSCIPKLDHLHTYHMLLWSCPKCRDEDFGVSSLGEVAPKLQRYKGNGPCVRLLSISALSLVFTVIFAVFALPAFSLVPRMMSKRVDSIINSIIR